MAVQTIEAVALLDQLHTFDAIIDARSPGEFALDHLPGAVNWPTLNDEERQRVGTIYKQVGAFEAKKIGAGLAAMNIGRHIHDRALDLPKSWRPVLYCWRGGKRSGSLALVLDQIGFQVHLVAGGYKAFRAALVSDIATLAKQLDFRVVCGTTGCGKTRLLQAIAAQGGQILDLEGLARHRSSVLGLMPGITQPSQKAFDTALWFALKQLDRSRPVFVESESKKVGNVAVPDPLMDAIRQSICINLTLPLPYRIALLEQDYAHFIKDPVFFNERLNALIQLKGKAQIEAWQAQVLAGDFGSVISELLSNHYDPIYLASVERNFVKLSQAPHAELPDHSDAAFRALACNLVKSHDSQA